MEGGASPHIGEQLTCWECRVDGGLLPNQAEVALHKPFAAQGGKARYHVFKNTPA
jgi:hypothetical protein